jgi:hypothetical protein
MWMIGTALQDDKRQAEGVFETEKDASAEN